MTTNRDRGSVTPSIPPAFRLGDLLVGPAGAFLVEQIDEEGVPTFRRVDQVEMVDDSPPTGSEKPCQPIPYEANP